MTQANKDSRSVDLNSDMGEGFGVYRTGDDESILKIVSSANVACGFHAGDPDVMASTFERARQGNVAVGAHPGYPDLWGFGRRKIPFTLGEIERLVAYQIGAAQALSQYSGHPISYVKAHGALGNLCQTDAGVARAVTNAIKAVDPNLACLAIALGHQVEISREAGLRVFSEIFADRAYTETGHLMPRDQPGAIIHDVEAAATRVVKMVKAGAIETFNGDLLVTPIDSICVHSDTPHSIAIAGEVKSRLEKEGISLKSFT